MPTQDLCDAAHLWQELVLKAKDRYAMGATIPGLPGILLGRTQDVAWGATYSFMDASDSWIEHCKDGKYRQGDDWVPFRVRQEPILRKGKATFNASFYENDHGVLDGDPHIEGYYLATRWSGANCGAQSLDASTRFWSVETVSDGMRELGRLETAFNWVLADRKGNIGYQMSGLMPKRRSGWSGLVPLPGWDIENNWQGFEDPSDLPRTLNPESGWFATANNDLNAYGKVKPLNLNQGPYRAERIGDVLSKSKPIDIEQACELQQDLYSRQAETFMTILRPLLPGTSQGRTLEVWDLRYDKESRGAFLFECFYKTLLREVFGVRGFGASAVDFLSDESGIFADFFLNFDRVLLSEHSSWFEGESRELLYRRVAERSLAIEPRAWGDGQKIMQSHLMFGGRLPKIFGFDRGPFTLSGGRATVVQGQIYRSGGRTTSFAPSFRIVSDLGTDECLTCLTGGPSERRFSKWYCSEMEAWLTGRYKAVRP